MLIPCALVKGAIWNINAEIEMMPCQRICLKDFTGSTLHNAAQSIHLTAASS